MLLVGCCGFPKGRAAAFQHFPLVEVQQTFYKPPRPETARRWREEAPADFTFTLKAWQLITHPPTSPTYRRSGLSIPPDRRDRYGGFRPTPEVREAWERTREVALALAAPIVVFQCPATFTPTPENTDALRRFFSTVDRAGLCFAWEPRGPWPDETVAALCRELNLIHCVDPFVRPPLTSGTAYFRLHGIGGYRYRFTDADLARILEWCRPFETAYVLFNNISMWEDGLRLQQIAGG
ncbi:MAG: DUF72 domain-containing protein [Anaerolineae bacterium]|nr:DUF72 domain-containing protein [Anaerolineae bacterium]MDW8068985.1 DUF72 domain-containing protein [Anaerolineae bacterium]